MKPIENCLGEENAVHIPDYPAGFTKRVQKRMWVEFKKGKGERGVSCTSTDITGKRWCAPKPMTYGDIYRIFQVEDGDVGQPHGYQNKEVWEANEVGHYHFVSAGDGSSVAHLEWFNAAFGPFELPFERSTMKNALANARARVRRDQWEDEHPEPRVEWPLSESDRAIRDAWYKEKGAFYQAAQVEEFAKVIAANEVPDLTVPVAPAQDPRPQSPQMEMLL